GTGHTQQVKACLDVAHFIDRLQALDDLEGLERHHPSERDSPVAEVLQACHRVAVGAGAPPVRYTYRLKLAAACTPALKERLGELHVQGLAFDPRLLGAAVGVCLGAVAEDDVVNRDPLIKAAAFVEVDDVIGCEWRRGLGGVGEGAAVAHAFQRSAGAAFETEELAHSEAVEAVALGGRVAAGAADAVDDRL